MTSKRDAEFVALFDRAEAAGLAAGMARRPRAMVVQQRASVFDDASPVVQEWHEPEGLCGFAWVSVRPGTSSFARFLTRTGRGRTDSYAGGVSIWIGAHGQSYERKEAHANAMAQVLRDAGLRAYADSRLD